MYWNIVTGCSGLTREFSTSDFTVTSDFEVLSASRYLVSISWNMSIICELSASFNRERSIGILLPDLTSYP